MEINFDSFDPAYFSPRDAEYITYHIKEIAEERLDIFDEATKESIAQYKLKMEGLNHKMSEIHNGLPEIDPDEPPTEAWWDAHGELTQVQFEYLWLTEQITSICEMKIGYLFKSIETKMKHLIKLAYPLEIYKDLYQWENMKMFFTNKQIKLHELDGYNEVIQIRKLNNNLKHSNELTEEIQKFPEFDDTPKINHLRYEVFYNRTYPKAESFIRKLGDAILADLFEFDDKRLDEISEHYYHRLGDEATKKLIEKLSDKLPNTI